MNAYNFSYNWFDTVRECWNNNWHKEGCPTNLKCLEVGCFEGQASVWILENLVGENGSFYAIDFFNAEDTFDHNIKIANKENLTKKIKGDAVVEMSALLKENSSTFDFIYIDASKIASENCFELLVAERLLKVGGRIIVDDFIWDRSYTTDPKHTPRLGIILFEQLTILCKSIKPPFFSQYAFKKINESRHLMELERKICQI